MFTNFKPGHTTLKLCTIRVWESHDLMAENVCVHMIVYTANKCTSSQARLQFHNYVTIWKSSKPVGNMKWSSVLLAILIISLSDSRSKAEIKVHVMNRYVIPNTAVRCFSEQVPCQTLEQYATQPDVYFTNNTNYYFQPGNHQLSSSLKLTRLQNVNFQGLLDDNVVNVLFSSLVSIILENCWNVKLTSIRFILPDVYSFSIVFRQAQQVQLHNVSVIGSGYSTDCSAILSQQSGIGIRDCKFIGIQGNLVQQL